MIWDEALVALLRRLRGRAKAAIVSPGYVTAAESFGMAGCLNTSTADTITRIEDFLRPL